MDHALGLQVLILGCLWALGFGFFLNMNPNSTAILGSNIIELEPASLLWEPYILSLHGLSSQHHL